MATIHVWSRSSEPKIPYEDKEIHGAHTIANGLAIAQPGDTVLVHGDASPYVENVTVKPGVLLQGRLLPIIDGSGNEARTVTMPINETRVTGVRGFEIIGGKTKDNGGTAWARNSSVVIEGNCIHGNKAEKWGGGICIEYSDAAMYPRASYVVGNRIYANNSTHGAGVALLGVTVPRSRATRYW